MNGKWGRWCSAVIGAVAMFVVGGRVALADYNSNLVGSVALIATCPSGMLLFRLTNQPSANGSCDASLFELDPSATANDAAFNRMYARLAQAYATGESVNIGFDNAGCGTSGYIRVHRVG